MLTILPYLSGLFVSFGMFMMYQSGKQSRNSIIHSKVFREWLDRIKADTDDYKVRMNDFVLAYNKFCEVSKIKTRLDLFDTIEADIIAAREKQFKYYEEMGHSKSCEKVVLPFKDRVCSCGYDQIMSSSQHKPS